MSRKSWLSHQPPVFCGIIPSVSLLRLREVGCHFSSTSARAFHWVRCCRSDSCLDAGTGICLMASSSLMVDREWRYIAYALLYGLYRCEVVALSLVVEVSFFPEKNDGKPNAINKREKRKRPISYIYNPINKAGKDIACQPNNKAGGTQPYEKSQYSYSPFWRFSRNVVARLIRRGRILSNLCHSWPPCSSILGASSPVRS